VRVVGCDNRWGEVKEERVKRRIAAGEVAEVGGDKV
jgi:hypothetical protein